MGLNELAYQIFSEQMEEFATRNERMVFEGPHSFFVGGSIFRVNKDDTKVKKVLESQRKGVSNRGGSIDAPNYKGARDSGQVENLVIVRPTSSKLRAYLKHGSNFKTRKADAIAEAKKHEGAHDRRRAWNEEHQKKYLANPENGMLKANGYI